MNNAPNTAEIQNFLNKAVESSRELDAGAVAGYIPELQTVEPELLAANITLLDGTIISAGPDIDYKFTLQSVSKLVLLIGLMEEYGAETVFSWINVEPSGQCFASIGDLERYGPVPSNPMINAGAICLASHIPGDNNAQLAWVERWVHKLFGTKLSFSTAVYESEYSTSDRNRSLAYLMKSNGVLTGDVEQILKPYCALCSYTATVKEASYLPRLLANGGMDLSGKQVISELTSNQVVSIMATCGLYNESGMHLVRAGIPAKSAVSGLIIASAIGRGGIAAFSPRINSKGTSVRGHSIINDIARDLDWHFAAPRG